jgi:penicillin-binding protein 1C
VTGAAPLWLEVVNALHAGVPGGPPSEPAGVHRAAITFAGGLEPDREELFVPGTELQRIVPKSASAGSGVIVYPAAGQVIAIDPDIPGEAQRIEFRARGAPPGSRWTLNGEPLAGAPHWQPLPGRWQASLLDASGAALDTVEFEVRGTALPDPAEPARAGTTTP